MELRLTPDQQALVQDGIERGAYRTEEDAVREAMAQWAERQRSLQDIRAALDEAEADLAAGRYDDYTDETLPRLAEEIKREARELRG